MDTMTVVGSGGWGTAMACLLAGKPNRSVRLWCANAATAANLNQSRENLRQLPGIAIPESVTITADGEVACRGSSIWIVAIPTIHLDATLSRLTPFATPSLHVVSLTKGITFPHFERPSERIQAHWQPERIAVLSGPNHAEEIARGLPASGVVAARDPLWAEQCRELFGTPRFRLYSQTDLVGVELAGAYKNVLGIAAGLCDGLGLGDNAKAALVTRGVVEMTRFGVANGADVATFTGLAGMGDLIATCFSKHGRNRRVGERIAKGEPLADVTSGPQVAEGVNTAKSVHERSNTSGIDVPIATAVYRVLFEQLSPVLAMQELMSRSQKDESR